MEDKRLAELADKYLKGETSPEEEAVLHRWWEMETNDEEEQIVVTQHPETVDSVRDRIWENLNRQIDAQPAATEPDPPGSVTPRVRRMDHRWLIAASLLFAVSAIGIIVRISRTSPTEAIATARQIKPGTNKAVLERSAGFNIVHTPKGGQYQVPLPDGSTVWLNAASSIRFPTVFKDRRQVELSGEAYFEVAGDPRRPFNVIVSPKPGAPACTVTVLGTTFDINSYADESTVRTTLLKGSLRVTSAATNRSELLRPGQQAVVDREHDLTINNDPDSVTIVAWHEGLFRFRNDSIQEVMTQIARWFDVEVIYSGKTSEHFASTLPRNADLYDDLQTLQKTGRVRFEVRGRTVTVFPR